MSGESWTHGAVVDTNDVLYKLHFSIQISSNRSRQSHDKELSRLKPLKQVRPNSDVAFGITQLRFTQPQGYQIQTYVAA